MPRLFIFGLGFSGRGIARRLAAEGWEVAGTTRSGEAADLPGLRHFTFDRDHPLPPGALAGTTHLLSTVPPGPAGDPVLEALGGQLRGLGLAWAGYLSTTGVYGDRGGGWVDDESELRPTGERSRRRVAAEAAWLAAGLPAHVFRLAGIYGPGRSAIDTVRAGTAQRIAKPGQVFGRIHVEDIAQVVRASMARPRPGAIYNLADDDPAPPGDVVLHACRLLGAEPPPELSWDEACRQLSPMALSFFADNKRVSNRRIKSELGVTLRYPTYREGLAAILEEDGQVSGAL